SWVSTRKPCTTGERFRRHQGGYDPACPHSHHVSRDDELRHTLLIAVDVALHFLDDVDILSERLGPLLVQKVGHRRVVEAEGPRCMPEIEAAIARARCHGAVGVQADAFAAVALRCTGSNRRASYIDQNGRRLDISDNKPAVD